ncbi:Neural-cadherin-like 21 [Homarus americanus]|uniref:Neural-cadherin-like 21 n=1 Tax=Homarus americanus TaxID=6706 RepID=A0A8J5JF64_HOMAM|nr:Neural-cadherin-like 21 [Homarus americanus]
MKALDRDPPLGRDIWEVRVQVRDGQRVSPSLAAVSRASRRPRVTYAQHRYSHHSKVSPETTYFMPQKPNVPVQGHYFLSRYPQVPGQSQSFSLQDPVEPEDQNFLSQSLAMPHDAHDASLLQHEENFEDEGWRLKKNIQQKTMLMESRFFSKPGFGPTYRINERAGLKKIKNSKKHGKSEGKNANTKIRTRKRGENNQKRRRVAERKKKLRDQNHQNSRKMSGDKKHKVARGRQTSGAGARRWKVASGSGYGSQAGVGEEVSASTTVCEDRLFHETNRMKKTSNGVRLLKIKYLKHRKHEQIGVKCKLFSAREALKLKSTQLHAGSKLSFAKSRFFKPLTMAIPEPEYNFSQSLPFIAKPLFPDTSDHSSALKEVPKTRHNKSPPLEEGFERSLKYNKHARQVTASSSTSTIALKFGRNLSGHSDRVGLEEGWEDTEYDGTDISKRDVSQLPVNDLAVGQLPEDWRYVKRFGAEGGGCEDYGVFNMGWEETEKKMPWYIREMRRDQVHVAETVVTVVVKDINDNAPIFPNATIYGEVQENGPIDLTVGVVTAWDADDKQESTNAFLTYSIEKNVIDERSGQAIFTVNPETGLVRTASCCLDRETTPEYHIQVVAVDGGGLKGKCGSLHGGGGRVTGSVTENGGGPYSEYNYVVSQGG